MTDYIGEFKRQTSKGTFGSTAKLALVLQFEILDSNNPLNQLEPVTEPIVIDINRKISAFAKKNSGNLVIVTLDDSGRLTGEIRSANQLVFDSLNQLISGKKLEESRLEDVQTWQQSLLVQGKDIEQKELLLSIGLNSVEDLEQTYQTQLLQTAELEQKQAQLALEQARVGTLDRKLAELKANLLSEFKLEEISELKLNIEELLEQLTISSKRLQGISSDANAEACQLADSEFSQLVTNYSLVELEEEIARVEELFEKKAQFIKDQEIEIQQAKASLSGLSPNELVDEHERIALLEQTYQGQLEQLNKDPIIKLRRTLQAVLTLKEFYPDWIASWQQLTSSSLEIESDLTTLNESKQELNSLVTQLGQHLADFNPEF